MNINEQKAFDYLNRKDALQSDIHALNLFEELIISKEASINAIETFSTLIVRKHNDRVDKVILLCEEYILKESETISINIVDAYFIKNTNESINKGNSILFKMIEQGSITAKYYLACNYFNGFGMEVDYYKAFNLFKDVENQFDTNEFLAECYYKGLGVEKDRKKAKQYFSSTNYKPSYLFQNKLFIPAIITSIILIVLIVLNLIKFLDYGDKITFWYVVKVILTVGVGGFISYIAYLFNYAVYQDEDFTTVTVATIILLALSTWLSIYLSSLDSIISLLSIVPLIAMISFFITLIIRNFFALIARRYLNCIIIFVAVIIYLYIYSHY